MKKLLSLVALIGVFSSPAFAALTAVTVNVNALSDSIRVNFVAGTVETAAIAASGTANLTAQNITDLNLKRGSIRVIHNATGISKVCKSTMQLDGAITLDVAMKVANGRPTYFICDMS